MEDAAHRTLIRILTWCISYCNCWRPWSTFNGYFRC